jgi:hypothetical protein
VTAIDMFERYFIRLQNGSGGLVPLKTATDIAADFVAKLLNPVYSQIDPFRIGENDLAMRVAKDYADRLAKRSGNLKSRQMLKALITGYPSHDFVIDRDEIEAIFKNVRRPNEHLQQLTVALELKRIAKDYDDALQIGLLLTRSPKGEQRNPLLGLAERADAGGEQPRHFHKVIKRSKDIRR